MDTNIKIIIISFPYNDNCRYYKNCDFKLHILLHFSMFVTALNPHNPNNSILYDLNFEFPTLFQWCAIKINSDRTPDTFPKLPIFITYLNLTYLHIETRLPGTSNLCLTF